MTSQTVIALQTLVTQVGKDELTIVLPIADGYFTNIAANPDPVNVEAQSLKLEVDVLAALPNMEAAAAKDIAATLKGLMDTEAASLNTVSNTAAGTDTVVTGETA